LGREGFKLAIKVARDVLPHGMFHVFHVLIPVLFHVFNFGGESGIEVGFKVFVAGVCHSESETQEWGGWFCMKRGYW